MVNQSDVQAAVRVRHGQAGNRSYNEDWMCLFDEEAIAPLDGTFNGRLREWLNAELVADGDLEAPYDTLQGAKQAYAERTDAYNWVSMVTLL
jgi:hypothetical protein